MSIASELQLPKRSMFDICAETLATLLEESSPSKTRLAQRCNLDTRAAKYINLLLGTGLIEIHKRSCHLVISDKGRRFLESYSKLTTILCQDQTR
jgi:predicted transcriptional regulator